MSDRSAEVVKWTVTVPRDTDSSLRNFLNQSGLKKSDLSRFVTEAVRWRLFDLNVAASRKKNAQEPVRKVNAAIGLALREVRTARVAKRV